MRFIALLRSTWSGTLLLALAAGQAPALAAEEFDAQKAPFRVRVGGELCPYQVFGVYVMPSQALTLEVAQPAGSRFRLLHEQGTATQAGPAGWKWRAPKQPDLYAVRIRRDDGAEILLNVFVMVPLSEARDGWLRGYRLGKYPQQALKDLAIYRPPKGLILVTPEIESTRVSPHFTLKQFLCKQAGGYPKLIAMRGRLLLKLEYLLQQVNARGHRADTFAVLSGYRTPHYNHAIGNVKYSRHQWGGAADIFIDEQPRDGNMDDLDGNGVVDARDADLLYDLIDGEVGRREYEPYIGGLGKYGVTSNHGPFVHVDARGFRARWGR